MACSFSLRNCHDRPHRSIQGFAIDVLWRHIAALRHITVQPSTGRTITHNDIYIHHLWSVAQLIWDQSIRRQFLTLVMPLRIVVNTLHTARWIFYLLTYLGLLIGHSQFIHGRIRLFSCLGLFTYSLTWDESPETWLDFASHVSIYGILDIGARLIDIGKINLSILIYRKH